MTMEDDAGDDGVGAGEDRLLSRLEAESPGLGLYLSWVAASFHLSPSRVRLRFSRGLSRLGEDAARSALRLWRELGILPAVRIETDRQVAAIWRSPLHQIVLNDVLGFFPPADADLHSLLPPACAGLDAFADRPQPAADAPYWLASLYWPLPELYLEPFLPARRPLQGCDLACGWGRASLTLRRRGDWKIVCCDLLPSNLRRLTAQSARAGLRRALLPAAARVDALPLAAASCDFVLAFDILEHLTDAGFELALAEILRISKMGAVLYAEIPIAAYCPAITHLQSFTVADVLARFTRCRRDGRGFRLLLHDPRLEHQFTFAVVASRGN